MANRSDPEGDQLAPEQPAPVKADPKLSVRQFRGELIGLRPSSRAGLSSARLSTADRIRKLLEELKKDGRGNGPEET